MQSWLLLLLCVFFTTWNACSHDPLRPPLVLIWTAMNMHCGFCARCQGCVGGCLQLIQPVSHTLDQSRTAFIFVSDDYCALSWDCWTYGALSCVDIACDQSISFHQSLPEPYAVPARTYLISYLGLMQGPVLSSITCLESQNHTYATPIYTCILWPLQVIQLLDS